MLRGVGPVYAKKLVRAFGDKVFEVIETTPDRLREVEPANWRATRDVRARNGFADPRQFIDLIAGIEASAEAGGFTGRGADVIVIDDPLKADEALSDATVDWSPEYGTQLWRASSPLLSSFEIFRRFPSMVTGT